MKQNFKNYPKLGILLFGIAIILVNCQHDDDFKNINKQNDSPYRISKINYSEVSKNQFVLGKLKGIREAKYKNQNKTIYSEVYDFEINTDYVTYIESDDGLYHSYTFYIKREVETPILENLLVSLQKDGSYLLTFVTYNTNYQEKTDLEDGKYVDLSEKVTYTKLDDTDLLVELLSTDGLLLEVSNKEQACTKIISTFCSAWITDHAYGYYKDTSQPCDGYTEVVTWQSDGCDTSGTGTGYTPDIPDADNQNPNTSGTTSDPPNSDGTNNGGSDNDDENEDITSPTTVCTRNCPEEPDPIHDKNCEELDKLINNPYPGTTNPFTQDGHVLNPTGNNTNPRNAIINVSSDRNFEHGYGLFNRGSYQTYGSFAGYEVGTQNRHVNFPASPFMFGTIHNHPYNSNELPMFSHDDIYTLLQVKEQYGYSGALNPNGDATFVTIMAAEQGGSIYTYALKIEDANKLQNINNYRASERKWDNFGEELAKIYTKNANGKNGSPNQYQKVFLNLIKKLDLGVSLYKMNPNDSNNPNQLETWERLSLKNDGTIDEKPCN